MNFILREKWMSERMIVSLLGFFNFELTVNCCLIFIIIITICMDQSK